MSSYVCIIIYIASCKYDAMCAQNCLKFLHIICESIGKMRPLLQDFLAIVIRYYFIMDTSHDYAYINPQYHQYRTCCTYVRMYKHITMIYCLIDYPAVFKSR